MMKGFVRGSVLGLISILVALIISIPIVSFAETDVTAKVQLNKSVLGYDRATGRSYLDVSITNISKGVLLSPIKVVINNISPTTVTMSNADGLLVNGSPYFVYTFNPQFLSPGNKTSTKRWYFSNPKQLRFTYTSIAVAQLPAAQAIVGNGETIVTVSDPSNDAFGTSVDIPPNAVPLNSAITINTVSPSNSNIPFVPIYQECVSPIIEFTSSATISSPVSICIPVNRTDGVNYHLYTLDEVNSQWVLVNSVIQIDNIKKTACATISHFSIYIVTTDNNCNFPTAGTIKAGVHPTCEQKLNLTVYLKFNRIKLLDVVSGIYKLENTQNAANDFAQTAMDLASSCSTVADLITDPFDLSTVVFDAADAECQVYDLAYNNELGGELCDFVAQSASTILSGELPVGFVIQKGTQAISDFMLAFNITSENQKMYEVLLADEFLSRFYSYGSNSNLLDGSLGLAPNSSMNDIIAAIASEYGWKEKDGFFGLTGDYSFNNVNTYIHKEWDSVNTITKGLIDNSANGITVSFTNDSLESAVRVKLSKPTGPITTVDLQNMPGDLYLNNAQTLEGLQYCTNITSLEINGTAQLTDLTPLAGLTKLQSLTINSSSLTNLTPLQNLTSLTFLDLYSDQVSDITPLGNLVNLITLELGNNQITNISPIQNLDNLDYLYLDYNQITDISPLLNNPGLTSGTTISLGNNPLSDTSYFTSIPQLISRGVAITLPAPPVPTNLSVIYQTSPVQNYLTWDNMGSGLQYQVYWDTNPGITKSSAKLTLTQTNSYAHTGVGAGYTYYYRVSSINAAGQESDLSSEQSVQVISITFNKIYGGSNFTRANSVQQTSDGGYILAGYAKPSGTIVNVAWLLKTDVNGNEVWEMSFSLGASNDCQAQTVQQTSDGGYILAGYAHPYGTGYNNFWLIKTDANGNKVWDKTFGKNGETSTAYSVKQTSDGGYILAGVASAISGGGPSNYCWLIKTDANGNNVWNKALTYTLATSTTSVYSVQQTSDGGYVLAGTIYYQYGMGYGPNGWDAWLVKTDANGNKVWDKAFGGNEPDYADFAIQTNDGGYILAADKYSLFNTTGTIIFDPWLIKTDANGNEIWDKTFVASSYSAYSTDQDPVNCVQQTSDGGYILAGDTYLSSHGNDARLIKTDVSGNKVWDKVFGGSNTDDAFSVQQSSDGGYIVAGQTYSYGASVGSAWLIKTDANGNAPATPSQ
jgi:hypothetical protein